MLEQNVLEPASDPGAPTGGPQAAYAVVAGAGRDLFARRGHRAGHQPFPRAAAHRARPEHGAEPAREPARDRGPGHVSLSRPAARRDHRARRCPTATEPTRSSSAWWACRARRSRSRAARCCVNGQKAGRTLPEPATLGNMPARSCPKRMSLCWATTAAPAMTRATLAWCLTQDILGRAWLRYWPPSDVSFFG